MWIPYDAQTRWPERRRAQEEEVVPVPCPDEEKRSKNDADPGW